MAKKIFKELEETHSKGVISIETVPVDTLMNGDLGIQIAKDGRGVDLYQWNSISQI